jgi:hypothetical protein
MELPGRFRHRSPYLVDWGQGSDIHSRVRCGSLPACGGVLFESRSLVKDPGPELDEDWASPLDPPDFERRFLEAEKVRGLLSSEEIRHGYALLFGLKSVGSIPKRSQGLKSALVPISPAKRGKGRIERGVTM